jgi:integrase
MQVYQEGQTFACKQAAPVWVKRRETELDEPGAIERANRSGTTVASMIEIMQSMPRLGDEIFPYNSESVSTAWSRACERAGIKDLHFHDLRHDGVSRLFQMGWDIPRVASVSGHRDWNSL